MNNTYETDYNRWIEETTLALRERNFTVIDWEHLIEEIEALGKTDLRTANSLIKQVIIHRLKLDYLPDTEPRKHWVKEINNFNEQLEDLLSASLKAKIDLEKLYQRAKKEILLDYSLKLPAHCPYSLEDLLTSP